MEEIDIETLIKGWEERIAFLEEYNTLLREGIKSKEPNCFETREWIMQKRNIIHDHDKEIESKNQFIRAYKADLENKKTKKEEQEKQLNEGFGAVIKELRETVIENDVHNSMKRGILKRFKAGKYTPQEKQKDFQMAIDIIQKATTKKEKA